MATFLYSFAGVLLGGVITYFVSRHYYQQASKELRGESEELRRYMVIILRGLEAGGLVEVNWGEGMKPLGIVVNVSAVSGARIGGASASANLTVGDENNDTPAEPE